MTLETSLAIILKIGINVADYPWDNTKVIEIAVGEQPFHACMGHMALPKVYLFIFTKNAVGTAISGP